MVVSSTYRYVFVEVPHTASTAISEELCLNYGGARVLYKHARYNEFWEAASEEERGYAVFAGIRHPMDEAVSLYLKFKHNHKGNFTNPRAWEENGGWVSPQHLERYRFIQEHDASFSEYFLRYIDQLYLNKFLYNKRDYRLVIRFEDLQEDFARMLESIGVEQLRPLPLVNRTTGKEDYVRYYSPEVRPRVIRNMGPFMRHWGYGFPRGWGRVRVPAASLARYAIRYAAGSARATTLRDRPLLHAAARRARALLGRGAGAPAGKGASGDV